MCRSTMMAVGGFDTPCRRGRGCRRPTSRPTPGSTSVAGRRERGDRVAATGRVDEVQRRRGPCRATASLRAAIRPEPRGRPGSTWRASSPDRLATRARRRSTPRRREPPSVQPRSTSMSPGLPARGVRCGRIVRRAPSSQHRRQRDEACQAAPCPALDHLGSFSASGTRSGAVAVHGCCGNHGRLTT